MKRLNYLLLIAIFAMTTLFTSCDNDDDTNPGNTGDEQVSNDQNATEENNIPTTKH